MRQVRGGLRFESKRRRLSDRKAVEFICVDRISTAAHREAILRECSEYDGGVLPQGKVCSIERRGPATWINGCYERVLSVKHMASVERVFEIDLLLDRGSGTVHLRASGWNDLAELWRQVRNVALSVIIDPAEKAGDVSRSAETPLIDSSGNLRMRAARIGSESPSPGSNEYLYEIMAEPKKRGRDPFRPLSSLVA